MRHIKTILVLAVSVVVIYASVAQSESPMQQRVRRVKEGTARILVNGRAVGSGFAVTKNLIATNFHVVEELSAVAGGQTQVAYASKIEVQLQDGRVVPALPHVSVQGPHLRTAVSNDVTLLEIPSGNLRPLKSGRFSDIAEGDELYIAGYPLGIGQPIVTRGMLSTKWKLAGYLGQGKPRDVAWLDITMNSGNSGGPVLLLADDPAKDIVIGIANFNLNPFAETAKKLAGVAAAFPGNVIIMGVDFKLFSTLVGSALASQSHGVGGCVAIDYLQIPK